MCIPPPYPVNTSPRKRLVMRDGKFQMMSTYEVSSTPLIKLGAGEIQIGCYSVSREAWLKLSRLWDDHLVNSSGIVQSGIDY